MKIEVKYMIRQKGLFKFYLLKGFPEENHQTDK
jgi:hypothetical protein